MRKQIVSFGKGRGAFTLVELLAVIFILGLLAGLVVGVSGYANTKAAKSKARSEMEAIKNAIEEHRIVYGTYPSNTSASSSIPLYQELAVKPHSQGRRPFLVLNKTNDPANAVSILDPWGNDYHYEHNPTGVPMYATNNNSRFGYDLWSLGADVNDSSDDINNWSGAF